MQQKNVRLDSNCNSNAVTFNNEMKIVNSVIKLSSEGQWLSERCHKLFIAEEQIGTWCVMKLIFHLNLLSGILIRPTHCVAPGARIVLETISFFFRS